MAKYHPAWSEMSQSHTAWSSWNGSESPSVEVAIDVRRYTILELMSEMNEWNTCLVQDMEKHSTMHDHCDKRDMLGLQRLHSTNLLTTLQGYQTGKLKTAKPRNITEQKTQLDRNPQMSSIHPYPFKNLTFSTQLYPSQRL